ncbi:hypothetical protein MHW47_00985 [Streptomyces sp. OfavH-34-F]|uniref:hypothetical protein n=1 Tax=Streptomyces sp. OfavH-34-F TaxID=2917760 RepID=UPI001EF2A7F8|nr:hypothetical protein [Streptomyces sp. OfavH-34-F]MCG7523028.1 hypothetical protein [Streptomyces sp. OfavH-34-F]
MPEYYSSIGEAVAAAMQHNIRLTYGLRAPAGEAPLQVRHLPPPPTAPYSVPGMLSRLTATAEPAEMAAIIEEVNGSLIGALPQLTELVAAAADWTRARLTLDDPDRSPVFDTWTRLAAAHAMLEDVREQLEFAEDGIAASPAERTDPKHHRMVNELRSRELLADVMGPGPQQADPVLEGASRETLRQQAARTTSPHAGPIPAATPPSSTSPHAVPAPLRASRSR